MKQYFIYILTNNTNKVLYTGVTNNLFKRVWEHKNNLKSKFTTKYKTAKLVYYEITNDINEAIKREKQIKNLLRSKKVKLISEFNPNWNELVFEE